MQGPRTCRTGSKFQAPGHRRVPAPVVRQAAIEYKAAGASGPGVPPGGARGGPRRLRALERSYSHAAGGID